MAAAWQGKELLRAVYRAVGIPAGRAALDRFYRWADGVQVAELSRLARTVRAWEAEILAWHATGGCSNGPTEAINLLIKKVKRVGHGFRNFANYRLRLLLHCGVTWQTSQTARLRGHSPRLWRTSRQGSRGPRRWLSLEDGKTVACLRSPRSLHMSSDVGRAAALIPRGMESDPPPAVLDYGLCSGGYGWPGWTGPIR